MRVVNRLFFILLGLFCSIINTFDVKVLLYKTPNLEKNSIVLKSKHGFIVSQHPFFSSGFICKDKCEVSKSSKGIVVNEKVLPVKSYYFTPKLSVSHEHQIKTYIHNWFDQNQNSILESSEQLYSFFDNFVIKHSSIDSHSYDLLIKHVQKDITLFLEAFISCMGDNSVVSLLTLQKYAQQFIKHKMKEYFLDQLVSKSLTKKDRTLLQQNKQYRYEFFKKHVYQVVQRLLQEYICSLPRNILTQFLKEEAGSITFQGYNYLGSFMIYQKDDVFYVINSLDIDDYLLSVIRHEGWPGWSLEVNKVLAVVCRTYLVWQMLQAQRLQRPYHIENGIRHQTYKGHHKYFRLKQAVDQTRDICIAYNNKPILAMFDACCGGIIPAHIDNSDYKKHTYLMRENVCKYCKSCKVSNWKLEVSHDNMIEILQKDIPSLTSIDSMSVAEKDTAGLVKKVLIETNDAKIHIPGKRMYSLFPGVKSFAFDVDTYPKKNLKLNKKNYKKFKIKQKELSMHTIHDSNEKKFVVYGRGYGHHVGLCQWGAMKLVQDHHWNYQKILQFYYPGTQLLKLSYQR